MNNWCSGKIILRSNLFLFLICITSSINSIFGASHTGNLWIAGNASIEITIDEKSGLITHLLDKMSGEDYCNQTVQHPIADPEGNRGTPFIVGQRSGGLILFDELKNRVFRDLSDPGIVSDVEVSKQGDTATLSFVKHYQGADFVLAETFIVDADGVRWNVQLHKTSGSDRTVRVVYELPLPLGEEAWAPIAEAPFTVKPWLPFSIDYGQSTSGAVGEGEWRTTVPLMVFYSNENRRALAIASPLEVPAVRIRYLSNTGALADFYWNSRKYSARERPYLDISNEDLGLRTNRDLKTGLLISTQQADWRPSLGWFYSKYREYFDPNPNFAKWDGEYAGGAQFLKNSYTQAQIREAYAKEYARGVRWEELHQHFVQYGQMIPDSTVKTWENISHPQDATLSRNKIEEHCRLSREAGIGTFLYYNTTESSYGYAQENFPKSIAKTEDGQTIGAFKSEIYPNRRACWLMNSDPKTKFGQYMIDQARQMVQSYPDAAGFFWDVYGRSYMFDFAHDDGITMVNNKPAYYPEFMYQRMMSEYIGPLLHDRGMAITANKPVTVVSTRGIDGIMMMEEANDEINPGWITAQSYLGLTRHVMILDDNGSNAEILYLQCLRYGAFNSLITKHGPNDEQLSPEAIENNQELERKYQPFINMFSGKKWVFYPRALQLPSNTNGNIFQLEDGTIMITMVSTWRALYHTEGYDSNLQVIARLPNASAVQSIEIDSVDLGEKVTVMEKRNGDQLTINIPKHGRATVILLHMKN